MSEKAFIYRVDGTTELVEFEVGKSLSLLQSAVEGYVQPISLAPSLDMWVNENYIAEGLSLNVLGSIFHHENFNQDAPILGNIIFTGGTDDKGETLGLGAKEIDYLFSCAKTAEPMLRAWEAHKAERDTTE